MSKHSATGVPPHPGAVPSESVIRDLISSGKTKSALDGAKQLHKAQGSASSESLLVDAYVARAEALLAQNMGTEAKALLDLVRERFPLAQPRLERLKASALAREGDFTACLRELNRSDLEPARRAEIERIIQAEAIDLAALAAADDLPPEHGLRQAAAALDRALTLVTSGPVTDEQIALPEVSHRSPLAPWKLAIRAIACFHRGEDAACREFLAAIKPETAPARWKPAMEALLAPDPSVTLKPAVAALLAQTGGAEAAELRGALAKLDRTFRAFGEGEEDQRGLDNAIRATVRACRRAAPDRLERLKRLILVRGALTAASPERIESAMEGSPGPDARFFRALACGLEDAGEFLAAEPAWERFLAEAVREGRFGPQSIEAAAVHLHIAEMLGRAAQPMHGQGGKGESHSPHSRFARACALDPHSEAFAAWKRWAQGRSASKVEEVCREWHRACPGDLEPLLYLMERAEGRSAFPKALALLEKAERADSVHPKVRAARLRLQGASALRSLRQRKTHLAEERLAALAALPQASQGVRPAFVNALRHLLALTGGDRAAAAAARAEVERLLEHKLAASLLIFGIADLTNHDDLIHLPELKSLSPAERAEIPKGLARAMTVASDFALQKFKSPIAYINEAQEQFLRSPRSLDTRETEMMGELGLASSRYLLAWAAAGAGLAAGGPAEAGFLLQRARALHGEYETRAVALAAAAVQLARLRGDTEVADRAIAIAAASERQRPVVLTLEQAREVIRRELASPAYPTPGARGPDYSDLVPSEGLCQCPACRARRGEDFNPFEDDEEDDDEVEVDFTGGPRLGFGLDEKAMRDIFDSKAPAGLPPDVAQALFEALKTAFVRGVSPEEILAEVLGPVGGAGKKRRRR